MDKSSEQGQGWGQVSRPSNLVVNPDPRPQQPGECPTCGWMTDEDGFCEGCKDL